MVNPAIVQSLVQMKRSSDPLHGNSENLFLAELAYLSGDLAYNYLSQRKEGIQYLREAVRRDPESFRYRDVLSSYLRIERRIPEAIEALIPLIKTRTDVRLFRYLGMLYAESGQMGLAEQTLRSPANRGDILSQYFLGLALMQQGRSGNALEWMDRAVNSRPEFLDAWFQKGTLHLMLNDPKDAALAFQTCLANDYRVSEIRKIEKQIPNFDLNLNGVSMPSDKLMTLKEEVTQELTEDILPFWMEKTVDTDHGGFIGEMSNDLTVNPDGIKSLVVCSRILWTYAAAARVLQDTSYLSMADRALDYLMTRFKDPEYDGYFWWLDAKGNPLELDKKVYGQAFTIYALSEHARAAGSQSSLEAAKALFELIESKAVDTGGIGYYDFCDRDWTVLEHFYLGAGEIPAAKTYNTHLHILEAYTNLLRVWPDEQVADKLRLLIEIHLDKIYNPKTGHMDCFFDKEWNALSDAVSYGHDVETSWLLVEGAKVLGDEILLKRVRNLAIDMASLTLEQGVDPDGGMIYEENPREVRDPNKHWWPQAEAVVGFLNAWQLSDDPKFLDACVKSWRFIQNRIIDHEHGEWFWSVTRDGKLNEDQPKVSPWKGPYHNARMGFEVIERARRIMNSE